ncbi:MAG: carbohydrate ABC transporter permease [Hungateiclostridium thermocellum]|nr:carbohydrate ABC transporter permease [Acetivibrio thermocellus]
MNRQREDSSIGIIGTDEKIIIVLSYVFMGIAGLIAIIPVLHVLAKSVSSGAAVTAGMVKLWPANFQLETIIFILKDTNFFTSLFNSLFVTVVGTMVSMFATITTAYPLSKVNLKGRKFVLMLYIITMLFYGGTVPTYMIIKSLGLLNTYAALILPFVIIQFNMLIVKNYLESFPESIEESAKLDGASDFKILIFLVIPIAMPVVATVSLLYAVNYWNNYFHAMLFTSTPNMKTLQLFLYDTINAAEEMVEKLVSNKATNVSIEGVRSAAIVLSMIPIICLYPLVQRFLVKGITIGSVKG